MDNVCRRVNLQQPDLFGLKFYSRRPYPKYRWVDLDRPLKKQLDKYAQQPTGKNHALKRLTSSLFINAVFEMYILHFVSPTTMNNFHDSTDTLKF